MEALRMLTAVNLRARWRAYAGIALLLGLTVGPALLAIAGARRTQSAHARFLRSVHAATMSVTSGAGYDPREVSAIAALPEVVSSRMWIGLGATLVRDGKPALTSKDIEAVATLDGEHFDLDRFVATQGRHANRAQPGEVVVNEYAAKRFGLHVGERVDVLVYGNDDLERPDFLTNPPAAKVRSSATVVGVGIFPDEVLQNDGDRVARVLLTPALSQRVRAYAGYSVQALALRHGNADVESVKRQVDGLAPPGTVEMRVTAVDAFHARQAMRPLSVALAAFGVIFGAAGLVLVGQAVARVVRTSRDERSILRALGARPRTITSATLLGVFIAVLVGVVLSVVFAIAASPVMPLGPVRRVEASPGVDVDATSLGVGALVVVLMLAMFSTYLVARSVRADAVRRRRPRRWAVPVVALATNARLGTPAITGLRFAVESGDDGSPGSGGAVVLGCVIAVAALVGAATFGASLSTLVHTHHLYGWSADAAVVAASGYGNIPVDEAHAVLDHDPAIERWGGAYFGFAAVDGRRDTPVLGMDVGEPVHPPIVRGNSIRSADEVVLGAATSAQLRKNIGDTVLYEGAGAPRRLRVVGIATFPTIGRVHAAHTSLGVGVLVVPKLVPGADRDIFGQSQAGLQGPHVIFVRYRAGVRASTELAHLRTTTAVLAGFAGLDVLPVQRPAEIVNSSDMGTAPTLLAAALGLGAAISLALALHASVRRHRRDLALLKTLGLTRRQLAVTTSCQATVVVLVGVLAGVPIGVAVGRILWIRFATELDVLARPTVPVGLVVGVALLALILANVAAALPGRTARRVRPATLLRAD